MLHDNETLNSDIYLRPLIEVKKGLAPGLSFARGLTLRRHRRCERSWLGGYPVLYALMLPLLRPGWSPQPRSTARDTEARLG